jgi:hypothetical protein
VAPDRTPPLLTRLAVSLKRGAKLRFRLSEAATVRVVVKRRLASHAARFVAVATIKQPARAGRRVLVFSARVARRMVRPGAYVAVATATDAAGNRSRPAQAAFRVGR